MPEPIIVSDRSVPLLHVSVASPRGATLDPEGKEGTTRLLLRLMRRSIRGIDPNEVDETFDALGATLGSETNRTVAGFHGGCIARSSDAFLDLLRRTVVSPDLSRAEFDRLVDEARAEWVESLDNDSALVRRFFSRALFAKHPYGRLAGGTHESLGRISPDDLKAVYPKLFSKKTVQLAFAGDVADESATIFQQALLADLPEGIDLPELNEDPPGPSGRQLTFIDKPERTQTQILIGCLGTHPLDEDHTPLFVGHTIFGGTFSARLSREVRGKRGWSYGAYSDLPYDKRRQGFSMWTFPQASDAADCIKLELEMLEELIEDGILEEELVAAKNYLRNSHVFSVDTASKRASSALDRALYHLPEDFHSGYLERISRVTVDEVNAALKARLSAKNLALVVLGTHSDIGKDIERCAGELSEVRVVPFDTRD